MTYPFNFRKIHWQAVCLFLLGLGSVRMALLLFHTPMLGFANNWDMTRLQACVGIWPDGVTPRDHFVYETPYKIFTLEEKRDAFDQDYCVISSQLLLIQPAVWLLQIKNTLTGPGPFSIQWIGFSQAFIIILSASIVTWLLLRSGKPKLAVLNALIFAIIFCDPTNTLFLNTFYTELSTLLFLYLTLVSGILLYQSPKPGWGLYTWFLLSLILLATSKLQHVMTGMVVGILILLAIFHRWRRLDKYLLVVLVSAIALTSVFYTKAWDWRPYGFADVMLQCNRKSAILGAILPASANKTAALSRLGLSRQCSLQIGQDCFSLRKKVYPCAEVGSVTNTQILKVLIREPLLGFRLVRKGVFELRDQGHNGSIPAYLGQVEGQNMGNIQNQFFTISNFIRHLPNVFWLLLLLFPYAITILSGFWSWRRPADENMAAAFWFSLMLAAIIAITFMVNIVGDGWRDFVKHNYLVFNSLYVAILFWLCFGIERAWQWYKQGQLHQ
jgi:hypothetical protein